jgi:hypothetical protein
MGILVQNSFTGELFPVDKFVIEKVLKFNQRRDIYWTSRCQTIYDMILSGI